MTDDNLFMAAMTDVTPLKKQNDKVTGLSASNSNENAAARREAAQANDVTDPNNLTTEQVELVHPDDIISYKKDGVQQGVFKNLRLGKYDIHTVLNLHGKSVKEARLSIYNFILDSQKANLRSLLIQHGKGLKSQPHQAIIKSYINKWLPQLSPVLAFHSAQPQHGGTGAVYVLLKKSDEARLENKEKHQKRNHN
jgi:DNA-nicking Smr family endonuclease